MNVSCLLMRPVLARLSTETLFGNAVFGLKMKTILQAAGGLLRRKFPVVWRGATRSCKWDLSSCLPQCDIASNDTGLRSVFAGYEQEAKVRATSAHFLFNQQWRILHYKAIATSS